MACACYFRIQILWRRKICGCVFGSVLTQTLLLYEYLQCTSTKVLLQAISESKSMIKAIFQMSHEIQIQLFHVPFEKEKKYMTVQFFSYFKLRKTSLLQHQAALFVFDVFSISFFLSLYGQFFFLFSTWSKIALIRVWAGRGPFDRVSPRSKTQTDAGNARTHAIASIQGLRMF